MTSRQFLFSLLFLSATSISIAQPTLEEFVRQGIQYHEAGEFDKAIETYKKALELDPESSLVNYEIALSYFTMGDYKEAIKYSDVVLKKDEKYLLQAYLTKGSALDMLGKTKQSIKLFEKALNRLESHYLLFYNLALNYYKINDLDNAEDNVINAILVNPNHSSSHLMLANIHHRKGNSIQTLLSTHYFLLLEPNSVRSVEAYDILKSNFGGNVSKDPKNPNNINITLSSNNDSQFGAAELMVSMLEASKSLEKNEGKTDDEMFVENTDRFFKVLGELNNNDSDTIWWAFYTTFFYDLAKSNHIETYCNYITQGSIQNSSDWLDEHESELLEFRKWLGKSAE